jgi:hypothetical protein
MGLLDLKTDLKSLKFGNPPASDRPGGGNSGQPYITDPIESSINPQSEDFLLRGGFHAPLDANKDVARLTKFFKDLKSPRGILFTSKQNILSRIGVATQASGNQSDSNSWKDSPLNEGAYTPLSTIAQAGVGFTGAHLNKQGANPFKGVNTYIDSKTLVIGENDGTGNRLVDFYNEKIDKTFTSPNLYSYSGGPDSNLGIGKTNILIAPSEQRTGINNPKIKNSGFFPVPIPPSSPEVILNSPPLILGSENSNFIPEGANKYTPPPKSGFSVFTKPLPTIIRKGEILFSNNNTVTNRYSSLLGTFNVPKNLKSGLNPSNDAKSFIIDATSVYSFGTFENTSRISDNNSLTLDQKQIGNQLPTQPNKSNPGSAIQDFRSPLLEGKKTSTIMSFSPSYQPKDGKTIDGKEGSRINMTSPSQKGNIISYTQGKLDLVTGNPIGAVDKINAQPIYKSKNVKQTDVAKNDLVKFRIGAVLRDGKKVFMHFRAFIDQFSDSYGAKWSGIQYMGRGEEFYKYGGFSRKISLSYTVAAQSKPEIMEQYKKLNFLASTLAPDYGRSGYMGGVLTTLTLGGWCYELPGFIDSLTLDIPQESPWEIGIDDKGEFDPKVKEMPHICKVTMNFTPIHTFRPELQDNRYDEDTGYVESKFDANGELSRKGYGNQRFLALTNGNSENYNDTFRKKVGEDEDGRSITERRRIGD